MKLNGTNTAGRIEPPAENWARDRLMVETFLPVAVVVVGIKLGKLLFAYLEMADPLTNLKTVCASWLVRLTVIMVAGFWIGKAYCPRRKWFIPGGAFVAILLAKLAQALWTRHADRSYVWLAEAAEQFWLVASAVAGVLLRDIAFLACFGLFVYLAVLVTPAGGRRALRVVLSGLVGLLLILSALDLAQYCKTGSMGSGRLLRLAIDNARGFWPMLRSEFDLTAVLALAAPLAAGAMTVKLVRRWCAQPGGRPGSHFGWAPPVALASLLGATFIHVPLPDHRFDQLFNNTYFALGDLLPWRSASQVEAIRQANRLPLLFDTANAMLRDGPGAPESRRNVVIIMLESARAGSASLSDAAVGNTPFLAELGRKGAIVPEMYAVVPRTCAAWVSVLGGIYPSTDEEMGTCARHACLPLKGLPALLSSRGYATAFFSAAHLSFGYDAAVINAMDFQLVRDADTLPHEGFDRPSYWGYEDRILIEPSLAWARQQRDRQKPFLLVMMTNVGHYDYRTPKGWQKRSFSQGDARYNDYLNCVAYLDSVIKQIMNGLEEMGVLRSSIVIILGDHGESFGEHGPRLHSLDLYEETMKIPAILYAPGRIAPGTSISGVRQEIDIVPTVLDALGLSMENGTLPGSSLLGPVPSARSVYFDCALPYQSLAMRRGALKFVYHFGRLPTEAYDLDQDPREIHDIASTLQRSVIEEAQMDMLVWRERVSRRYNASDGFKVSVHKAEQSGMP